jgi:phosphoribosylformylglycinamidine (FGAM) synthase-like amidotransferase family enzyme
MAEVKEKGVSIDDFELMTVVGQGSYGKVVRTDAINLVGTMRTVQEKIRGVL